MPSSCGFDNSGRIRLLPSRAAQRSRGIVHRDLKPDNVYLVEEAGDPLFVKLLDFGIAKVMNGEGNAGLTETGVILGTPYYMSPEQARADGVDHRTDVYALRRDRPRGARALLSSRVRARRPAPPRLRAGDAPRVGRDRGGAPARSRVARAAVIAHVEPEVPKPTDEEVARIPDDAPVAGLPLSVRARNALDRASLTRAQDLRGLAPNRLSAIRGVGPLVAREILDFRDRWTSLRPVSSAEPPVFFPGYGGEDLPVDAVGPPNALPTALSAALIDGGLPSWRTLAQAPSTHVKSLVERHGGDVEAVRRALAAENERANQQARPTTLEGWIETTVPRKRGRKDRHLVRALFGLDPPFEGRLDVTVREVAEKEGKTTAAVYIALGKARDEWSAHAAVPELREHAARLLEGFGGAAPLATLADDLARTIPHASDTSAEVVRAMAATLLRVVVEVVGRDPHGASGPCLVRLSERKPWIFASDEQARLTRELAKRADELAARPTLASTGEVRRAFAEIIAGTPLALLSEARLFELAAAASETAACSARLEIYPRGLDPKRAVELCSATFKGGVTEAEVRARVLLRYPEAAPLPERPLLDHLLEPLGFTWDAATSAYTRPGEDQTTTLETHVSSSGGRAPTALPSQPRAMDPDAIDVRQFDDTLKHALEMNAFRLLGVRADRAHAAALTLRARLDAELVVVDVELGKEIAVQMKRANMKTDDVVHAADREGPEGPAWKNLQKLVRAAADALADRIFPPARPLLLVQPGPIARYDLTAFVERIVSAGSNRETPAVFLLVPGHDTGGQPRIDGTLIVPGVLPGQSLWVSAAWLANRHNAAA